MTDVYECTCAGEKRYRITFADCDEETYVMEYCQKCYELDDKQYMISMEKIP